jgi:hypothetical protein
METVKNLQVERQLFSLLPPIINKPRLSIVYPAKLPYSKVIVHDGVLTEKHYMCLDIVSDLFTKYFIVNYFNGKMQRRYNADFIEKFAKFNTQKAMEERLSQSQNHDVVTLTVSDDVIYSYPFMRKYRFKKIAQFFEELSKLSISAQVEAVYLYRVKKSIPVKGELRMGKKISNYYKKMPFTFKENNFFDFGNFEKGSFKVILKNALGNLLMYNCGMLNHVYVPDEFYTLSKYAQFLYRKIIANGFNTEHEYPMEMVTEWLNLRNSTITQLNKKIITVLEELKEFGYVEYGYHPIRCNTWYSITKKRKIRSVTN